MKPKYKLGQQVYGLKIGYESIHFYQGEIGTMSFANGQYYYGLPEAGAIPEENIYKSKKALKIAFNQAFEKLNNTGEPF